MIVVLCSLSVVCCVLSVVVVRCCLLFSLWAVVVRCCLLVACCLLFAVRLFFGRVRFVVCFALRAVVCR